jgi:activator of 2-hydroxyglutaryl-CoA dehydratase
MIVAGCDIGSLTAKAFIMNEKGRLAGEIKKTDQKQRPLFINTIN